MYETILIPYNGSNESELGAKEGISLAESLGATVHALYVIDLPGAPRTVSIRDDEEEMRERYREYGEEITQELCDMAADAGIECVRAIRSGAPAEEIVDYAEENDLDAIVMGMAYRGKFRGIIGSTSDKVVRTATIPVVTKRMQVDDT